MRARGGVWICGVAVCGLVMSACAPILRSPAIAESPPFSVVERRQAFTLPAAIRHVVVHNRHGDVRIRWSDRREIGLYATVQRIGATTATAVSPGARSAAEEVRSMVERW